jgi:hypothetical protein
MASVADDRTMLRDCDLLALRTAAFWLRARPRARRSEDDSTPDLRECSLKVPSFYLSVKELGNILNQIVDLINGPSSDDDGILRPTQHAVDRASKLLIEACHSLSNNSFRHGEEFYFPKARVSADSGGLRIEWHNAASGDTLRLVVPGNQGGKEYLYRRFAGVASADHILSEGLIALWIKKIRQS